MKINRKSLIIQEHTLKAVFPESTIIRHREESLTWIHSITPSPLSETYKVKLQYLKDNGVKVYVINPKPLVLAKGKSVLPHVYDSVKQQLCLYYPRKNEWNMGMLLTESIIPWISEWLFHYELWVGTGDWKGGGIHGETSVKNVRNRKEVF
jgi:hypothetical protein